MLARAIQLETGDRSPFRTDWLEGMIRHG